MDKIQDKCHPNPNKIKVDVPNLVTFIYLFIYFEIECRQANAKAQEAVDHLASFPSGREKISLPGIELPTSSLRFGYLSTVIL